MSDMDLLGRLLAAQEGEPAAQSASGEGTDDGPETPRCSRKGCRVDAAWALKWNNPRIHTAERRKIWLACDEHRAWLHDYLAARDLFREELPLSRLRGEDGDDGTGSDRDTRNTQDTQDTESAARSEGTEA